MSRPVKPGGPPYIPAARGGLIDPRSTGGPVSSPSRSILTDRRSTR
jgi:hypothetical protein